RPCHEDAVSLQGAAGPAGDGGGEPGIHELRQDVAVSLSSAGQWQGAAMGQPGLCSCPVWGVLLLWVQPSPRPALGLRLLPLTRTMNRSLCESNSSLRSALLLGSHTDPGAVSPAVTAQPRAGTCAGGEGQDQHPPMQQERAGMLGAGHPHLGCSSAGLGQQRSSASSTDTASSLSNTDGHSSEDKLPPSPCQGTEQGYIHTLCHPHRCLSHQGCERREEPAPPCPMYRLVLAGDGGTGKSSFLLRLCMNEFRGDISSTLGVDFQIKQLLVDGEQTTLQIWDTAGQER
ncbi:RASEF protein, partial [Steatornis caripensis]|nr:RASEF protein [Steatornis caripensis]